MPLPEPGEVHVWQAPLVADAPRFAVLRRHLCAEEALRAGRLLDPERARRFVIGRGTAREILSGYLGTPPQELHLGTGAHGKPLLASPAAELHFNLSHSGDLLVVAVSGAEEVGIDLELMRPELDFAPLARTSFSPREQSELFALSADRQIEAFYRCWTRKEAYLKGRGTGFSLTSTLFDVTVLPGTPAALCCDRADPAGALRWRLADLAVTEGYCAALAFAGDLSQVSLLSCR